MKKSVLIVLLLTCSLSVLPTQESHAIIWTVITKAVKKIIKAIDLNIQRLQNTTIGLQNAQKVIENQLSKLKLDEITNWTEKQKKIYQQYFEELQKVKAAILYYRQIADIINQQKSLIDEYRRAFGLFRQDKHFSPKELDQIYAVYSGIIAESVKSIDQILTVVSAFALEMGDAQRLEVISKVSADIERSVISLRRFTSQNIAVSLQRSRDIQVIEGIRSLYGLK